MEEEREIPKVKYSDLYFEVSTSLKGLLEEYTIRNTQGEIALLRDNIIRDLNNVGINQGNYDYKEHHKIKIDTINLEIDNFYNTKHSLKNKPNIKPNALERLSD